MGCQSLTLNDLDLYGEFWVEESRNNFYSFRQYIGVRDFKKGWFQKDISHHLQQFYKDLKNKKRPILVIEAPPQHGKSRAIAEFLAWLIGKNPEIKSIFAAYSDRLGVRTNRYLQRIIDSEKYQKVFPEVKLGQVNIVTLANRTLRNNEIFEIVDHEGSFRNTTTNGSVTGEGLDLGVIDDPVKGRAESNSKTIQDKTWDWFTDDFYTRFSEHAGLILILTRWSKIDLAERLKRDDPDVKTITYKAISEKDEEHRKAGIALFPQHKSIEFLMARKNKMALSSWVSLYQQSPIIKDGNIFKSEWWQWWKVLPKIKYKFITVDTAQKTKIKNDWTVFQCWGAGVDGRIYLLDKKRKKMEAPELRRETAIFYNKHNTSRVNSDDPILRGMYIEDKSSGTGLLQELRLKKLKVIEVPRINDKYFRADDASIYVKAGLVVLNEDIPGIGNLTQEAQEFPNGAFDDDIDTTMTAIEVEFINKQKEEFVA